MGGPVRYEFVASGQSAVISAFASITTAAKQNQRAVEAAYTGQAAAARRSGTAQQSEARRGASEIEKLAKRVASDQEKAAKAAEKAAEQGARAAIKGAEQRAKAEAKAYEYVYQLKQRYLRAEEKAEEKLAAAREKANAKLRSSAFGVVGNLARGGLGMAAGLAGGAFSGAVGLVGGAARESMKLQELSTRLSVNARGAGEGYADPTALRKEFENAAIANPGIKATDIAEGATNFVGKTGDLDAARRFAPTFATVASASGADVKDISDAAASLFKKFDIKTVEEMRESLAALTYQGKAGAFELKDAAAQFEKVGAAAQRWGVQKGVAGVRELGGLNQIARDATGSSEQAATSVEDMLGMLIKHSKKLEGHGVHVFEKGSKSKTRPIQDVLVDLISKNKGGQAAIGEALGIQGVRGASSLLTAYNDAAGATKGSAKEKDEAGVAAMREVFKKAIDAQGDWGDIMKDAAMSQQTASAQIEGAWQKLQAAAGDRLAPALAELAAKLAGNQGIFDMFVAGIGLASDALMALADFLQRKGLIDGGSHQEKAEGALKRVGALTKEIDAMGPEKGMSEEQKNKLALLTTARNKAVEEVSTEANAGSADKGKADREAMFNARYGKAGAPGHESEAEKNAASIRFNLKNGYNTDRVPEDETDAQKAERKAYASGTGVYAEGKGKDLDTDAIIAAAKQLEKAGISAAQAISNAKAPGYILNPSRYIGDS